jgi:hypothetical protein
VLGESLSYHSYSNQPTNQPIFILSPLYVLSRVAVVTSNSAFEVVVLAAGGQRHLLPNKGRVLFRIGGLRGSICCTVSAEL